RVGELGITKAAGQMVVHRSAMNRVCSIFARLLQLFPRPARCSAVMLNAMFSSRRANPSTPWSRHSRHIGGDDFTNDKVFSDTWNGLCSSPVWSQASPAHRPGVRRSPAMSTGPGGFTVLLFGGAYGGATFHV